MSLDWIKSDQDSGAQQAYNILLPAYSYEWVGFSFLKSRTNLQYFTGSLGLLPWSSEEDSHHWDNCNSLDAILCDTTPAPHGELLTCYISYVKCQFK